MSARMQVIPRAAGVCLVLGSLHLDLDRGAAEQLHEEIGRALMPGQPARACECANCACTCSG